MTSPSQLQPMQRTGVWIVGALGSVATTMIVGAEAIRRGRAGTVGLVTETPLLQALDLVPVFIGTIGLIAAALDAGGHVAFVGSLPSQNPKLFSSNCPQGM